MDEVCPDKMASRKGTQKGKFPSHDRRRDNTGKALGVRARRRWVGTLDTEHLQHRTLRTKNRPTSNSPDFNARHRNRHQKVLSIVRPINK